MAEIKVTVELKGAASAVKALEDLEFNARRRVVTAAVRSANKEVVAEARRRAPVLTGLLRKQIKASIKMYRGTGVVYATVRARATAAQKAKKNVAWYMNLVVGGTKPHEIRPRNAKSLAIGGQAVAMVQHPGTKPNDFIEEAATAVFSRAVGAFEHTFAEKMKLETDKVYAAQRF